ncbi:N-acetylglucosamine-6-phosphate deacetylase (plasmid) [Pseudorhodobacter turbinis]|uniref:N-acetylglucosamine-6-phosphate deacetylase n=1 Tax=Pseudorhodobacter turbinis TaxID=2500533 RepID=A0A4P8EKT7_9RHOB|nr:N-acetylglucosamine-6-phosphate deacetylase [Pseudorhodobacter turbinis]QCO57861.1 N-acetylglucosamine-6-phosphate deacetylase [Pseudorhodobacter turbinis]
MTQRAYIGADIFDGSGLQPGMAILLEGEVFRAILPEGDIPAGFQRITLAGGTLMPGFVDLQVNGGGGVMFNSQTSAEGLAVIAQAHATTGTRALLPTLITDTVERTRAAVDAVEAAIRKGVSGIIGIHLEGPHLSLARKGAHDPALIRKMEQADEDFLCDAAQRLPNVMITVAPESVSTAQIARLSGAGVIVSIGHTDCSFDEAEAAFAAGARCVTHLFNAMSQLGNREPGLVGAALQAGAVSAGMIADGIHVHPAAMRLALAAKQGPAAIFLVTDAMATAGSDITEFTLNGRRVLRENGDLRLEDGTLAGADLDFSRALSVMIDEVGIDPARAYAMVTSGPAKLLTTDFGLGGFTSGQRWNGIWLDDKHRYTPIGSGINPA